MRSADYGGSWRQGNDAMAGQGGGHSVAESYGYAAE